MAVTAYFQPKFEQNHIGKKLVNMSSDTFTAGLIKSTSPALAARGTSEGYEFVSDLLANNGSAMTEENGTGYARLNLTSVTYTVSALVVTFTAANLVWSGMTFSDTYCWIHDETASSGTDATRALVTIFDLGGTVAGTATQLTLAVNGSGLVTWTAAQ
jgi:hypothetical protein